MDYYFWSFAVLAVAAGLFTISWKNPLPCALGLLTVFVALAGLYLHLHAPLVAIFQVAIYAGAILVLVVFVIMLLVSPEGRLEAFQANKTFRTLGAALGVGLAALLALGAKGVADIVGRRELPGGFGDPGRVGDLLFSDFLLHFEVASVLLLVALIGAIYLAKRNL
ncbi:NADH-quinone oxidoreductase subunit J [Dissulfurirhabdus thermomarina]|uniref:NADH-quinone oxidoreductase subunit J n=1 Tax=Dissulfurirhabdus thermomarina TaxID=1765737 RepID=A0A6N9TJN2_DISTH|nr:NADH-quinone oxidoreductase subunit J [Dissulfurirhabdus thermomarina]NDY41471.1 NADH-quinone oxidoreductase subunit J [Dissulfurirhabdus thermomarina]NMX24247.1 NADH-quinone oxidoreductase subunit J [Dissulfurirhabdus thermomarina]